MFFQYLFSLITFMGIHIRGLPLTDNFRSSDLYQYNRPQRTVHPDSLPPQQQQQHLVPEPTIIPLVVRPSPPEHVAFQHEFQNFLDTSTAPSHLFFSSSSPTVTFRPAEEPSVTFSKLPPTPVAVVSMNLEATTELLFQSATTAAPLLTDRDVVLISEFIKQLKDPVHFLDAIKQEILAKQNHTQAPVTTTPGTTVTGTTAAAPAVRSQSKLGIPVEDEDFVSKLTSEALSEFDEMFGDRTSCPTRAEADCPGCYEMCVACVAAKCCVFCDEESFAKEIAKVCSHLPHCHECVKECY